MAQLRFGNGEQDRADQGTTPLDHERAEERDVGRGGPLPWPVRRPPRNNASSLPIWLLVAGGVLVSCRSTESLVPEGDVGEVGAGGRVSGAIQPAGGGAGPVDPTGAAGETGSMTPAAGSGPGGDGGDGGDASGNSGGRGEGAPGGAGGTGGAADPGPFDGTGGLSATGGVGGASLPTGTGGVAGASAPPENGGAAAPAGQPGAGGAATTSPGLGGAAGAAVVPPPSIPSVVVSADDSGTATTWHDDAAPDGAALFSQALGTNGRSCATCHAPEQSMSFSAATASARFEASQGNDPLFRPVDGAVSPNADVSTLEARRAAYALLLSRGLIRVGLPFPGNADFDLIAVKDPYGYASASELSLFRRPLPAANLRFSTAVMWDGREGLVSGGDPTNSLRAALASQASHAVAGHAQADVRLTASSADRIVQFELGIYSAQTSSTTAGPLDALFAFGGPQALIAQEFFPGINVPLPSLGPNPSGLPFNPIVFTTFAAWESIDGPGTRADAQRLVAEGERLFNLRTFSITNVPGLTTDAQPSLTGTCSLCHNAPQAGSTSTSTFFNLGLSSDTSKAALNLPLYTLKERSSGKEVVVSDPGRALITGSFQDVGAFKVPTLRGLAARAPYFHNGGVATLSGVVGFYNGRFSIGLTDHEKAALTAFLASL